MLWSCFFAWLTVHLIARTQTEQRDLLHQQGAKTAPQLAALVTALGAQASDGAVLAVRASLLRGIAARIRDAPSTQPRGTATVQLEVDLEAALREVQKLGTVQLGKAPCAAQCTLVGVREIVWLGSMVEMIAELR